MPPVSQEGYKLLKETGIFKRSTEFATGRLKYLQEVPDFKQEDEKLKKESVIPWN